MKKLSIFICASFLLFGCNNTEPASESSEVVTEETETMATEETMETTNPDIVALASNNPSLSTLVQAIQAADLAGTLQGGGPYTVFAPTNEAFAALPAGTLDNLLKPENKQQLVDILTYHVTEGSVMASDLSNGMMVKTLNGKDLKVMLNGDQVMINNATVTSPNVQASNGVVHVVDKVILPPGM
ncbi:fasciclin domain-containing protein [Pontibacter cellulosilyticus]|uniref:Fasciclin domain-containing protein n=1 Tax=Pontibacter cellulosilyticus TaxID=1720253 RepID=A0A923N471_9BACT|nr:fasciclin domain-containing protein [Pontibacter cellulosilyticus]MBC5991407.1 fasciclin domain-containing protein [Pontibacter cellulosilyticus]